MKLISGYSLAPSRIESHPVRGAWIEIHLLLVLPLPPEQSHPVRGAWIEISIFFAHVTAPCVAPREGCVD